MTKTLGKQKASKTITTSLSSINIHYQSRDSPSFKSIFQTWHNCSRLSPPPPCLQSLLHSTRAFDDRGFNRRSLERSINDRSTRARDGTLPFRFFDDVCWKIKWRHPTYDYDFDESSWKRGTNKKKKKKNEPSFRTVESRSAIEDTEARSESQGNEGSWPVVVSSDREPFRDCGGGREGEEIVKFRLSKGWHNGNFRFEILLAFSACLSTSCTKVFFFFFYRGCYADASMMAMEHESFVRVHHVWQEVKASKQSILLKYSGELGAVSRRSEILFMDRDNRDIERWRDFYL